MSNSIEYAGTLYNSKGAANRAAVQDFLMDGSFTEQNLETDNEQIADEMLENDWELPAFNGNREDLIEIIAEAKQEMQ